MPGPKFRYSHYDLKELPAGTVLEITLSAIANVRLMNADHFQRFKEALKHKFIGGVAKKSPIRLTIPEAGHWHLVVDMEGHNGFADSGVKVIGSVPAARFQVAS